MFHLLCYYFRFTSCVILLPGHVTDLKDQFVTQISLGKAHAVALTKEGHIYTFGINNKGQCGRDFTPGASKDGKYCKATHF